MGSVALVWLPPSLMCNQKICKYPVSALFVWPFSNKNCTNQILFPEEQDAHRWTQVKFYWTLVKIINKWIHCHQVRNQWTKTMHHYVFALMSSVRFRVDQPWFPPANYRDKTHNCETWFQNLGDIPIRLIRAHVWGLSECPPFLLHDSEALSQKLYDVQFSRVFIDSHV